MTTPELSVVVVTYNDLAGLKSTLCSVEEAGVPRGGSLEIIIQDGGTPGIRELRLPSHAQLESSSDAGIYDAMNRGLSRSRGRHVWFLNGGDLARKCDWHAVFSSLRSHPNDIVYGGFELRHGQRRSIREARNHVYLWHALPTSHQAIFYPRADLARLHFDESFRVSSDYALTASLWMQGVQLVRIKHAVATFSTGGLSTIHAQSIARDSRRVHKEILNRRFLGVMASQVGFWLARLRRSALRR